MDSTNVVCIISDNSIDFSCVSQCIYCPQCGIYNMYTADQVWIMLIHVIGDIDSYPAVMIWLGLKPTDTSLLILRF